MNSIIRSDSLTLMYTSCLENLIYRTLRSCRLVPLNITMQHHSSLKSHPICPSSSPLKDDEGYEAHHNGCQDGAVNGDEVLVQLVAYELDCTGSGGGGGGLRGAVGEKGVIVSERGQGRAPRGRGRDGGEERRVQICRRREEQDGGENKKWERNGVNIIDRCLFMYE